MTSTYDFFKQAVHKKLQTNMDGKERQWNEMGKALSLQGSEASARLGRTDEECEQALLAYTEDVQRMLVVLSRLEEILSEGRIDLLNEEVNRILEEDFGERPQGGFDPYGAHDEEGLHEDEGDRYAQDDYDIEEVDTRAGDGFSYDYRPTHHIEVELNDGPPREGEPDPNEPSCEFTFEYDRNGKLVPTSNNIEEKLRLMSLQTRMAGEAEGTPAGKKKKKSHKKKKKTHEHDDAGTLPVDESMCLFCQYESFFGVKPVNMMRWYDEKIMKEELRRQKIKEKLEHAKLKALKRQRQTRPDEVPADDLEGSGGTVAD